MAKDKVDVVIDIVTVIDNKVDKMSIDVSKNTHDLNYHIKRTDLLEKHYKSIEDRLSVSYLLKLTFAVAAGLGTISGAIYSIIKVIQLM